jgi:hypothetical protein
LVSFGHCAVCPSSIYGFRWTLWYLLAIVLSVPLLFTASDDHFGILWLLCCLSLFYLRLQMTTLVSFGHCAVCPCSIYGFRWPLWYLVIVLSVPVRFTASDKHWYIVVIVLSVPLLFTASDDHFGIFWPLCCLSLFDLRLQMTTLVSCGHCAVCHSSIYGFRWTLWYLLAIVLSVPLLFTAWDDHFWYLVVIVLSVPLLFTASDDHFGILWSLCCLSLFYLRLQMNTLVSFGHCAVCPSSIYGFRWPLLVSCGHCAVCPSSIYGFRWPLWYLVIVLSVPLLLTASDDHFGILSLCCLSLFYLRLQMNTGILWSLYCLSLFYLQLQMTILVSCGHCAVCPSSIFRWPFWYLVVIVLSVPLRSSDDHFGILWSLCCLSLFDLQMTTLVSCGHCAVCPFSIFRWPLWYLVVIVLSVPLRSSDDHFGILWSLYCLSLFYLRLQMTILVSCGHCAVCPSSIFRWPLWYLVVIVLSVPLRSSDDHFGILWSLCCLSLFDLQRTTLVSCAVCPSSIYGFRWPLWYLQAFLIKKKKQ